MQLPVPEFSLVLLVGPSGCGKSSFAARHFRPTEVISSDACRALVSDDESNQAATPAAFEVLHLIAARRLAAARLTVIDATNLQPESRQPLIALAREYHAPLVAILFDLPEALCQQRNQQRPGRHVDSEGVRRQFAQFGAVPAALRKERFKRIYTLSSPEEVESVHVTRERLPANRREISGPLDIIGDVHGCASELEQLLEKLGYIYDEFTRPGLTYPRRYTHPAGRVAVFVGDLVDRGPRILDACQLVMNMTAQGNGFCVLGNHDDKLLRRLRGHNVQITHGLENTLAELNALPEPAQAAMRQRLLDFLAGLPSHLVFDRGRLVVAHAGIQKSMIGRESGRIRQFTLYGETSGELDPYGLPVRHNWAARYRGKARIAYGHNAVTRAEWLNNTIDLDTGCVYGGALTALRYPELELEQVQAARVYREPRRPLQSPSTGEGEEAAAPPAK